MRRTIIIAVCAAATFVAVGAWAITSIDARSSAPAALQGQDTLELMGNTKNLPVQAYDAF